MDTQPRKIENYPHSSSYTVLAKDKDDFQKRGQLSPLPTTMLTSCNYKFPFPINPYS